MDCGTSTVLVTVMFPKKNTLVKLKPDKGIKFCLCPGMDSNHHTLRRRHLKTVRLPISPPGHSVFGVQI